MKFARQCLSSISIVQGKLDAHDHELTDFQKMKSKYERTWLLSFKQVNKVHRTRKIDIVIYQEGDLNKGQLGLQPLCAIELKSFNPPKNKIIADLERNIFFFKS